MDKGEYLTVSQMAKLHHISRQTLIYYDHIGLFRPQITDDKGYRYYSYLQVNVLKEILFLKKLNLPLEVISKIVKDQDPQEAVEILKDQRKIIDAEIEKLIRTRKYVDERLLLYDTIDFNQPVDEPYFRHVDERSFLALPFEEEMRMSFRSGLWRLLMKWAVMILCRLWVLVLSSPNRRCKLI